MSDPRPVSTALWVVPVSDLGGVARHVLDIARVGLPGYRLVVAAPEGPLLDRLRAQGIPVVAWQVAGRSVPATVAELRSVVRRLRPAVVHSHLAKADFLVAAATAGLPGQVISTEHHVPADLHVFHPSAIRRSTRRIAHHARIRRFDHLIAVSESTARDLRRHWRPTVPVSVVLNGVDRRAAQPRPAGLRVLALSRLAPEKNVEDVVRAFAQVHNDHPEASLTVAGEGPSSARIRAVVDELGLAAAVRFPGFVDADTAMADHDVLVQASLTDNLSYTLLDAVAAGMGVAATDVGGNAEILPPHCLAPVGDVRTLAERIVEQGTRPEQRPTLPPGIPTVEGMTRAVVSVYEGRIGLVENETHGSTETGPPAPEVSVIIACYQDGPALHAQMEALAVQDHQPDFEVILADNEGSQQLHELARAFAPRLSVRVVDATNGRGQAFARNVGAGHARGNILAFCDNDDLVSPGWLTAVCTPAATADVLVTGPLRLDAINPEYTWRTYLAVSAAEVIETPVLQTPFTVLGYLPFAHGCNMAVRRRTYLTLGGMDERLRGGSEDVDFSWRAQEAGVEIVTAPEAVIDYRLRRTTGAVYRQRRGYARSQLALWGASRELGRPVRGMSIRWAVAESAKLGPTWIRAAFTPASERYRLAAWSGAVIGNLVGQLTLLRRGIR